MSTQGYSPGECYDQYVKMKPGLGWMHIKDYRIDPSLTWTGAVDEERLKNFVPSNVGGAPGTDTYIDLVTTWVRELSAAFRGRTSAHP